MESHGHGVTPLTGKRGGNFVKHRFVQLQQQQQQQLAWVGKVHQEAQQLQLARL